MRATALLGRLIGLEVPAELVPEGEDPARLRERFFAALRFGIEAWACREPLVFAFEDIHWADDGMLEAIEHLAQWVRAPLLLVCLARDELLDRRPDWGRGHSAAKQLVLEPLNAAETQQLVATLLPEGEAVPPAVVERSGGNPLFAEEMACRIAEEGPASTRPSCPTPCRGCWRPASTRWSPSSGGWCNRPQWSGGRSGRARWRRWRRPRARISTAPCCRCRPSTSSRPTGEGGRAGERELAFKHVLVRDVAYGMLPKAVRSRKHYEVGDFLEERAGDRGDEVVALLAEHYGRAAALGREGGLPWTSCPRSGIAPCALWRRRATPRRCSTPTARPHRTTATPARSASAGTRACARA